jgi:hypothetical protein
MKRFLYVLAAFLMLSVSVFAASQQTSSTAASSIIDRAEVYLNDSDNRTWTAGELLTWLNDGMLDIVNRTHCLETTEEINLSTNNVEFPITSNYITVKAVIYTDEKAANGTMEINGNWNSVGTPTVNARSATQVNNGTYSRQFNVDAADEGIKSDTHTLVISDVYFYRASVYPDHTGNVNVQILDGDGTTSLVDKDFTNLTQDAWNIVSGYYTASVGGSSAYIAFRSPTGETTGTWYVDDVTVYSTKKGLKQGRPDIVGNIPEDWNEPSEGEPSYWYDWGGSLGIYPTLSDVSAEKVTLYLITRPTAIAASANVTTPAIYDVALVLYIAAQAMLEDLKPTKYLQMMMLYDNELRKMRGDMIDFPKVPPETP